MPHQHGRLCLRHIPHAHRLCHSARAMAGPQNQKHSLTLYSILDDLSKNVSDFQAGLSVDRISATLLIRLMLWYNGVQKSRLPESKRSSQP